MQDVRVAAAQFEHRDGDKAANLQRVAQLTADAAGQGAKVVSFHECCLTGYTFLQHLDRDALLDLAEPVPAGPTVGALQQIAAEHDVTLMAGLLERETRDGREHIYNCYVTVNGDGYVTKFRKLHPFISPHLTPGEGYVVEAMAGMNAGFLICYDNNLPENGRATTLLGAEVIFAPHVTGCTPSSMPGRGAVDPRLWKNRHADPVPLRREFAGLKGREWLMRWLPARAWENGVYIVYSNAIGVDGDTIKPGLAMILDPFGEVVVESTKLGDDVVVAELTGWKVAQSSGKRYRRARRPELYQPLLEPAGDGEAGVVEPGWKLAHRQ